MSQFPGGTPVSSLNGTETVEIGPGSSGPNTSPQIMSATVQQIADLASLVSDNQNITALTTVGAGTITAAGIAGGFTARGGAQSATAFTDTTATAALIVAALPAGAPVGTTFLYTYDNATDAPATLSAGVGVTLSGNVIVPKLTWAKYLVKVATSTTVTITFVEGGQLSPLPVLATASQTNTTVSTLNVAGFTSAQISTLTLSGGVLKTMALPTAADIIAAIPNARVGAGMQVTIRNTSAVTQTLTGLTGTQVSGLTALQPNTATVVALTIPSLSSVNFDGLTNSQIAT